MLSLLPSETTVGSLKAGTEGAIVVVYDLEGSVVSDESFVGTGYRAVADGKEYTIIVKGDLDGDGVISSTDYLRIKTALLSYSQLSGVYFEAGDVDDDEIILQTDYLRIKSHFLGLFDLYA